jgi:hypothetical protein
MDRCNRIGATIVLLFCALSARGIDPTLVPRPRGGIPIGNKPADYVLIGWSDLGMHCLSPRYQEMCILPPYNTVRAIVIRKGVKPQLVTQGIKIRYSLDGNQTVEGKTDFWTYVNALFGKQPGIGVGLTGNRLSGSMTVLGDCFEASGIPALPYNDAMKWDPYQHATLIASGRDILQTTKIVVPVSDEMDCQKCHASGGVGAPGIHTPTLEGNILTLHDLREGTNLMSQRPVLCAKCHSDNALGATGMPGVPSMSHAMHVKHASVAQQPKCQDCHPGAKTQCNRSRLEDMGPEGTDPKCDNCHGDLNKVAETLRNGRRPWIDEPTCAECHGSAYSTGTDLYRNARGHGGVYCVACHNSPHAWLPSRRADDNLQAMTLQGNNHAIGYRACNVCHTDGRTGEKPPHGNGSGGDDD